MTNKLRSVIEELHYNSTTMTVDPDSPQVVYYKDAVKTVLKTLDAIIKEIEEDPMYLAKTDGEYEEAFDHGYGHVINKLKQAREELSTSLTQ